jgi:hypothetical protein
MLKTNLIFIIITVSTTLVFSQDQHFKSAFLSAHTGAFYSSISDFDKTYDSQIGFVYGLGFGLPLSGRSYIYGKATLFAKTGIPVIQTYSFENGVPVLVSETKEGTAEYTQWIINGGYLYNLLLNQDWTLGINGGIAYSIVSEEQKNITGTVSSSIDGSGIFGLFIGAVIEKNFNESHFSVFFEPQFNFNRSDIKEYGGNYGGINLNLGARYYFKERNLIE